MRVVPSAFLLALTTTSLFVTGCPSTAGSSPDSGTAAENEGGVTPTDAGTAKKNSAGVMLLRTSVNGAPMPFTYASGEFYKAANDAEQAAIHQRVTDFLASLLLPNVAPGTCEKEPEPVKDPPGLPNPLDLGGDLAAKDGSGNTLFKLSVPDGSDKAFYSYSGSLDLFGFKGALSVPTTYKTSGQIPLAMGLRYGLGTDGGVIELKQGADVKIPISPTPPDGSVVIAHFAEQRVACKALADDIHLGFLRISQASLDAKFGAPAQKTSLATIDILSLESTGIDFGGSVQNWSFESLFTSSIGASYYF
ncbi:MAG: hypothetical protein U0174_15805 [Polyangiaceae bacterium]